MYGVSQKDFSEILDWGRATITRYENHQVQDRAHDDILRKIESDPKWFIEMLKRAEFRLSQKAFIKYNQLANLQFRKMKNQYLYNSILALYSDYNDDMINGGVLLNLNKVNEVINYFALHVESLHKVKLMKMLWYSDNLNYKRYGKSITGLVYRALPLGAVPEGYEQILDTDNVRFEVVYYDLDRMGYKFHPIPGFEVKELSDVDIEILDTVISSVGHLNSKDIVEKMHNEVAYEETQSDCIISFSYADRLSIN
jgi:hypothetical protein